MAAERSGKLSNQKSKDHARGLKKLVYTSFALILFFAVEPHSVYAEFRWSGQVSGEGSSVSMGTSSTTWHSEKLIAGFTDESVGGIHAQIEKQTRDGASDTVFGATAYRRLSDWTVAAGVSAAPNPAFWFRREFEGELSRRIIGTFVLSAAYHFMDFPKSDIHQVQPALTWYNPRGEVQVRLYATRNRKFDRTSLAFLVRSVTRLDKRFQVTGAFAAGDRIFDIAALPDGTAGAWTGRLGFRMSFSPRDAIEIEGGYAHEDPGFNQRTVAISYRRVF
jgi:YaiO family outer membrane protein